MNPDFTLYIAALVAFIVGFLIIKKVTSCLVKAIVLLVLLGILAFVVFHHLS